MRLRSIFWAWLPLAVSFELMMLEGPTVQRAIGALANPVLNLAAFGLAMQLSLLIESPVIMLLATAIALVRDSQAHKALRRFTLNTLAVCTLLTLAVAFTPLYGVIARVIMHQPADVAAAARPALQIMLFWSAAIGWRRFYQGILVRFGQTRLVSWGTAVRLSAIVSVSWGLAQWGGLSGARVGACAVMAGVLAEAAATSGFALPLLRRMLPARNRDSKPLSQRAILRFHTPLAATTLLMLFVGPLSSAALALLADPHRTLAAAPVVISLLMVLRGWGFAIQEITVAQAGTADARSTLYRFAWFVGGVTTAATALIALTPLLTLYLRHVIHAPENLAIYVRSGLTAAIALPLVTALTSCARGLLVASDSTRFVYRGMGANLAVHAAILSIGLAIHLPGMLLAFGSVSFASLVELLYLSRHASRAIVFHQPVLAVAVMAEAEIMPD